MPIYITDIVAITTAIAALISAIAAALWGKGLSNAKDEIIKTKDAQIESLRSVNELMIKVKEAQIEALNHEIQASKELNSTKIREYFLSMKEQLEQYIEDLKSDLQKAQEIIDQKDAKLLALGSLRSNEIVEMDCLRQELDSLKRSIDDGEYMLHRLQFAKSGDAQIDDADAYLGLKILSEMKVQQTIVCPACGGLNRSGARFCRNCGRPIISEALNNS